jgi:Family of unknown function (DUF5677)
VNVCELLEGNRILGELPRMTMPKAEPSEFRTDEEYRVATETFARLTGHFLFQFARHPLDTKNRILQNFVARTVMMVRGIRSLWDIGDAQDCWILHRCLMDRYFHVVSLGKDRSYEMFDDWSFRRQYEAQDRVRSDPDCKSVLNSPLFTPTPEQAARYSTLAKSAPKWKRPKAEHVAKEAHIPSLYDYGYDFASMHVHPMANDGLEDFYAITKLEPKPEFPSQISVLHNSLMVGCLLVNEALNQSDFRWMAVVFNFYDHLMKFLETGATDYMNTFTMVVSLGANAKLCEPVAASTSG